VADVVGRKGEEMSNLKEAVLAIADEMEVEIKGWADHLTMAEVKSWAKMLRIACKAAGDGNHAPALNPALMGAMTAEAQNRNQIELAKKEFKGKVKSILPSGQEVSIEEDHGGRMAEIADGPAYMEGETTMHPVDSGMPAGSKMLVGTSVYQLRRDGKLWFLTEATVVEAPKIIEGKA